MRLHLGTSVRIALEAPGDRLDHHPVLPPGFTITLVFPLLPLRMSLATPALRRCARGTTFRTTTAVRIPLQRTVLRSNPIAMAGQAKFPGKVHRATTFRTRLPRHRVDPRGLPTFIAAASIVLVLVVGAVLDDVCVLSHAALSHTVSWVRGRPESMGRKPGPTGGEPSQPSVGGWTAGCRGAVRSAGEEPSGSAALSPPAGRTVPRSRYSEIRRPFSTCCRFTTTNPRSRSVEAREWTVMPQPRTRPDSARMSICRCHSPSERTWWRKSVSSIRPGSRTLDKHAC